MQQEKPKRKTKGSPTLDDRFIANKLYRKRVVLGLSQQDVAEAVGVSLQQVQKYEKAVNRLSGGTLKAISDKLRIPIEYFFRESADDDNKQVLFAAEDGAEYDPELNNKIPVHGSFASEREVIALVQAFGKIPEERQRKKIIELVKSICDP